MITDRDWMMTDPIQREIIWLLRSIRTATWTIATVLVTTTVAVGLAIAMHL